MHLLRPTRFLPGLLFAALTCGVTARADLTLSGSFGTPSSTKPDAAFVQPPAAPFALPRNQDNFWAADSMTLAPATTASTGHFDGAPGVTKDFRSGPSDSILALPRGGGGVPPPAPEPGTWALLVLGGTLLLGVQRSRRSREV